MKLLPVIKVTDIPPTSVLLGTRGSRQVIENIQNSFGSDFFGTNKDPFKEINNAFVKNVVAPIRNMAASIKNITDKILNPNEIRELLHVEDFKAIPEIMHMPILTYPPIKNLLKQGRVNGFGIDADDLPEDAYGRLISNGRSEDVLQDMGNKKFLDLKYVFKSEDPELNCDEIIAIDSTRRAIDMLLDLDIDPTDPESKVR